MDKNRKIEFINEMTDNLKEELLKNVDKMPEEWDGIELRQLISDKANEFVLKDSMNKKRKRKYNNTCIVNNI